jgi:hypothetical protein
MRQIEQRKRLIWPSEALVSALALVVVVVLGGAELVVLEDMASEVKC